MRSKPGHTILIWPCSFPTPLCACMSWEIGAQTSIRRRRAILPRWPRSPERLYWLAPLGSRRLALSTIALATENPRHRLRPPKMSFSVSLAQADASPDHWRGILEWINSANDQGLPSAAQVAGRPVGLMLSFQATLNPFVGTDTYKSIRNLDLDAKLVELRRPKVRAAILDDIGQGRVSPSAIGPLRFDKTFVLGDRPNYEQDPNRGSSNSSASGLQTNSTTSQSGRSPYRATRPTNSTPHSVTPLRCLMMYSTSRGSTSVSMRWPPSVSDRERTNRWSRFVRIRGVDRHRYNQAEMEMLYWGIGMHLGSPWAQTNMGTCSAMSPIRVAKSMIPKLVVTSWAESPYRFIPMALTSLGCCVSATGSLAVSRWLQTRSRSTIGWSTRRRN